MRTGLAAAFVLVAACSGDSSDDDEKFSDHYQANELTASYGAFADDANLRVFAALLGTKGFVRLRGSDTFEIEIDGKRMTPNERILGDRVHYIVEAPPPPTDTEVVVTFVHGAERVVGRIKLTGAFALKSPPRSAKKGEGIQIDLEPRPDLSKWQSILGPTLVARARVVGECIESGAQDDIPLCAVDAKPGECKQGYPLVLDTSKLRFVPGTKSCDVGVEVKLTSRGQFEGAGATKQSFKGGGFDGHRLKSFDVTITE